MQLWIDGQKVDSSSDSLIEVINPATEEKIGVVPAGTKEDVERAVASARRAWLGWRCSTAGERAIMLHSSVSKMRSQFDDLVKLLTVEEGKPGPENEEEIDWAIHTLAYYAELGRHLRGRVIPSPDSGQLSLVLKEPYGVVVCIVPWNYPILLLMWKVAPALAAGNTVVIKPPSQAPLTVMHTIQETFDHFPPGVVNVVSGRGSEIGDFLVSHPDVRCVAFTGSTEVGKRIAQLTANQIKKLHLELGGKDPFIVADDAPIELAVEAVAYAALINAGQVCTSTERVYVPAHMVSRFSEALAARVAKLRLGPGIEATTDVGPLIGDAERDHVLDHIKDAVSRGARLLSGGKRPHYRKRGFFLEPTVLVNVDHTMQIMREETFGPTIPIMAYDTFEQAIKLANDTDFGLGACLYSCDARKVRTFYEEVNAGTIWINDPLTDNFAGPFGGMKMSGIGRELGLEGIEEFWQTKHVHWDIKGGMKDYWYPY